MYVAPMVKVTSPLRDVERQIRMFCLLGMSKYTEVAHSDVDITFKTPRLDGTNVDECNSKLNEKESVVPTSYVG